MFIMHTQFDMPLTAITDFAEKGKTKPLSAKLAEICSRHRGFLSVEAEDYLLINQKGIEM